MTPPGIFLNVLESESKSDFENFEFLIQWIFFIIQISYSKVREIENEIFNL